VGTGVGPGLAALPHALSKKEIATIVEINMKLILRIFSPICGLIFFQLNYLTRVTSCR
jgi:hypothetical protein